MPSAPPVLRIAAAEEKDVPLILRFIRQLAEFEKLSHEVVAEPDALREHLFGAHPAAEVVIAYLDSQAVGFALFFTSFSTFLGRPGLYLEDLFVSEDARGQGIGKALLQHVAQLTSQRNYGRLEWAVLDWNQPAIDFYKSLGAKPLDDWTTFRLNP